MPMGEAPRRRVEAPAALRKAKAPALAYDQCRGFLIGPRQRSTLPQSHLCSTIDVGRLDDRVRDGIGYDPSAIATEESEAAQFSTTRDWNRRCAPNSDFEKCQLTQPRSDSHIALSDIAGAVNTLRDTIKPFDRLVPVSSALCRASTPGLSTS